MDMAVALQLLDSALGHPTHVWVFESQHIIQIGRLESNDIVIVDPLVSRYHAVLVRKDGDWVVVSLGRHGTLVDGESVEATAQLGDAGIIRLGANGPVFEFRRDYVPSQRATAALEPDASLADRLRVDEGQKWKDVDDITQTDVFRNLRHHARELRRRRAMSDAGPAPEDTAEG
jgi:pSer/pThr/pTyr-binding forkhead associated (FHA) protein